VKVSPDKEERFCGREQAERRSLEESRSAIGRINRGCITTISASSNPVAVNGKILSPPGVHGINVHQISVNIALETPMVVESDGCLLFFSAGASVWSVKTWLHATNRQQA